MRGPQFCSSIPQQEVVSASLLYFVVSWSLIFPCPNLGNLTLDPLQLSLNKATKGMKWDWRKEGRGEEEGGRKKEGGRKREEKEGGM